MGKVTYDERESVLSQKYYVTTAIAYLNGPPHVGHAYEFLSADIISRYHTLMGRDTKYVTGSDEHGQKVENTAIKNNLTPIKWCDKIVKDFYDLNQRLNLMEHTYVRTTNPKHEQFAQWLWKRCADRGDIYLGTYKGWYNVKEETFVTNREAEAHGFKCPDTGFPYEQRHEEAYFFRMSKYHDQVENLLRNTDFAQPETRRNELVQRLAKSRLEDLCVSRSTLKWGIPVPGNDKHVMYVWFDALSNYLSAIDMDKDGSPLQKFWPADCHVVGKDIIWFHCVIWPAMLMSTGLPLPKCVFGHGFVQAADGSKMSKSLNNAISPMECLTKFESDTFRYYLVREGHYGQDVRFSVPSLIDMHNSDLCSVIGNLVHRVVSLTAKSCDGKVPSVAPAHTIVDVASAFNKAEDCMSRFALEEFAQIGLDICKDVNKYLTEQAPWKIKDNPEEAKAVDGEMSPKDRKAAIIRASLEAVYIAAHYLYPIIPGACEKIWDRLSHEKKRICELGKVNLIEGRELKSASEVLFTQIQIDKE